MVTVKPLMSVLPIFGALQIMFLNPPDLDFELAGGTSGTEFPTIVRVLREVDPSAPTTPFKAHRGPDGSLSTLISFFFLLRGRLKDRPVLGSVTAQPPSVTANRRRL